MASILPGFEYDIFISYRQKDNRSDKWVTQFVKALSEELDATFKHEVSIYFDENPHDGLLETHHVSKSLEGKLKCLIFIPIISQTYCDPKSFAWQHEFCAFIGSSKNDQFGLDLKLKSGNVASRVLPVKIHDLDTEDQKLIEEQLGSVLRGVEFIFRSPGINRPLTSRDDDTKELTHTLFYRNQINKVANAIKEVLNGMIQLSQQKTNGPASVEENLDRESGTEKSDQRSHTTKVQIPLPAEAISDENSANPSKTVRRGIILLIVLLLVSVAIFFGFKMKRAAEGDSLLATIRNLKSEIVLLSSIERGTKAWEAYELVKKADGLANKEALRETWLPISRTFKITTTPPGAKVYVKPYSSPAMEWTLIGQTPIDSIQLPFGSFRVKIEKEGYATQEDLLVDAPTFESSKFKLESYPLLVPSQVPEGMVFAKGDSVFTYNGTAKCEDFFIDRYEVTNKAYKQFVDAGGYTNRKFWKFAFQKDGKPLSWEQAIPLLVDETGRPGPSTWVAGTFREGEGDLPVNGVSWYEAAAYAEFVHKMLPTIYHFRAVSEPWANVEVLSLSNINGKARMPVGTTQGMTRFGTFDLAGNVREWVINSVEETGHRIIPGGAWNDNSYVYAEDHDALPFDRSEYNGFRCIKPRNGEALSTLLTAPVVNFKFDMSQRKLFTAAQYEVVKHQFDYELGAKGGKVQYRKEYENWIREKIRVLPVYGSDSMSLYLFLPKNTKPPFQTVIYYPGGGAGNPIPSEQFVNNSRWDGIRTFDFLLSTGRAVLFPVYYSTMERFDPASDSGSYEKPRKGLIINKEIVIKQGKDFRRSVDYLSTRKDIDMDKLGYFGLSQGGGQGAIMLAIDNRIKTGVFVVCGISTRIEVLPEIDRVNYLPHVKQPVLMLNSQFDWNYPYDISQKPFFDLLGTEEKDKKLILYNESGHNIPWQAVVKETLNWYDHYLGKVNYVIEPSTK